MKRLSTALLVLAVLLPLDRIELLAGQALTIRFASSSVYCLFDSSCTVPFTETESTFTLADAIGDGILQTRTFAITEGPAAGHYGYEYRIDLTNVLDGPAPGLNCIESMRIRLGVPVAMNFDGSVGLEDVYQVGSFGTDKFVISATRDGSFVTFNFKPVPVCPGETLSTADRTGFFGIVASAPPRSVLAELRAFESVSQPDARAPNLAPKISLALLYELIVVFPPPVFVAPSPGAAEGRRQSLLNRVRTTLELVEQENFLPAVQHLEQLRSLTDGGADDWIQDDPDTRNNEAEDLLEAIEDLIATLALPREGVLRIKPPDQVKLRWQR